MTAIRIEGLRKTYGAVKALDGLDWPVETAAIFGFLGPNGAGKTTTCACSPGWPRPAGPRLGGRRGGHRAAARS